MSSCGDGVAGAGDIFHVLAAPVPDSKRGGGGGGGGVWHMFSPGVTCIFHVLAHRLCPTFKLAWCGVVGVCVCARKLREVGTSKNLIFCIGVSTANSGPTMSCGAVAARFVLERKRGKGGGLRIWK